MTMAFRTRLLSEIAAGAIPASFDDWPQLRASLAARRRRRWRQRAMQLAAVGGVFVLLAATLLTNTGPAVVSAETLLDRAGAVGDGLAGVTRTYHITATTTVRPRDSHFVSASVRHEETWFGGDGRMRQEVQTADWSTLTVITWISDTRCISACLACWTASGGLLNTSGVGLGAARAAGLLFGFRDSADAAIRHVLDRQTNIRPAQIKS